MGDGYWRRHAQGNFARADVSDFMNQSRSSRSACAKIPYPADAGHDFVFQSEYPDFARPPPTAVPKYPPLDNRLSKSRCFPFRYCCADDEGCAAFAHAGCGEDDHGAGFSFNCLDSSTEVTKWIFSEPKKSSSGPLGSHFT